MIFCELWIIIGFLVKGICRLISTVHEATFCKRRLSALIPVILVRWIWRPLILVMEVILDLYLIVGTLTRLIFILIEADSTLLKANWGLEALWWANSILVESIRRLIIRRITILYRLSLKQILAHHRKNIAHVAAVSCVASITQWWQTFREPMVILRLRGLILY